MFGAFDENGNVRGVAVQLSPPFGPYEGEIIYEMQLRSNAAGDLLSFKYYDASKNIIFVIAETYTFTINDIQGDVEDPVEYTIDGIEVLYGSDVDIGGFQFDVTGVTVTGASGGAAEDAGFSISNSATRVIGFSSSGATIPAGAGNLLTLNLEGNISEACLTDLIISDDSGNALDATVADCTVILIDPSLFTYNTSTLQAFYYFDLVLINGIEVESSDWVGAFNGDVCVGARRWDTSGNCSDIQYTDEATCEAASEVWDWTLCNGGVCDLPIMGDDGSELTTGYMLPGDFPTFKIYDTSENEYYDAMPSENIPWNNFGFNTIELLSVNTSNTSVFGCTDPEADNYNPDATIDDGSCCADDDALVAPFDCASAIAQFGCDFEWGDITISEACPVTCDACGDEPVLGCTDVAACNYNASATIDNDSCYYEGIYDCDGNCIAEIDCAGECGGSALDDECGVCDNYIATNGFQPDFPYGECDCLGKNGGSAYTDNCGVCDTDASNDCVQDCAGTWGGSAYDQGCGCEVYNQLPTDGCDNTCGSTLELDECGICGGSGSTSDCGCNDIQTGFCDCEGNELDECGICGGNSSTCEDCAGVSNGDAVEDNCGICDNDTSNDCIKDCAGIWGGTAGEDECGICDNDTSNDCIKDCAGIWGGTAGEDECGVCGGDGPEQNYNCEGNCIAEIDCQGICGGDSMPISQCTDGSMACSPADCNLDISLHLLPDEFGISKIFPNPFNPITQIQYELTQFGLISIKIYDIQGRVVDQLMNEYQSPGHYSLNWNAVNHASGMYIVEMLMQLESNEVSRDLQKILYLK